METDMKGTFLEKYLTPIAVLVGALIIGGALVYGHAIPQAAQPTGQQGTQPAAAVNIQNVKTAGDPFIGDPNAPVTIAFWFDYQCPFCKQFETTVMPQIYSDYVATGKVKIVFKDFQFLGNDSLTGGEFARALWATYPDKFYDWYKAMFNAQDEEGDQGFGNLASIETLTATIPGIDVTKVVANLNANKTAYDAAIQADMQEGQSFGINGTPSFIIGTQLLTGAQPYSAVAPLLDAQLQK